MAGCQPNFTTDPTEQTPHPGTAGISAALPPSAAAPPPSVSLPHPADPTNGPYKVFISHAGEDKTTIAIPLREKLRKRGISAFVDMVDMPPGTEATQAMVHAMETASVGVFVMSPEFVARKWPMKELMHFLRRVDECKAAGHKGPTIVPFFYRLGVSELYDEPRLDRNDKYGNNLYEESRFYERQQNGEPEASIAGIKAALTRLHNFMGVENTVNTSNDTSYNTTVNRNFLLDMLCDKVCQAVVGSAVSNAVSEHLREAEHDAFRPHFDKGYDASELVFNFDRKDSNGNACTQEGKILEMLLDESMDRNRAIAVRGIGGVGKTSLLRKMRSLDSVFERFKDGVYYMELGKDATREGLKEVLISMVLKSGGKQAASKMRSETDMAKVMEVFQSWFANKVCLFVIDDVWETKEVTRPTIYRIWNLHESGRDSKILLTTRSKEITAAGKAYFFLEPREALEDESRAMLYSYTKLKPEQGQEEDHKAANEILGRCAGLPLLLGVAGKTVKALSFRRNHTGCMAYRLYAKQLKTRTVEMVTTGAGSHEGLCAGLKISIELVEERKEKIGFDVCVSMAEMHRRLSVIKKQMGAPMSMLKQLWELENEHEAAWIAKEFEQVGLADVEYEMKDGGEVEILRLHDSVYEFAVYETKLCNEERVGHKTVVDGYGTGLRRNGWQREWWSKDLEDDQYIHRNLCRHLKEGGLEEELFGLLLSPEWLGRQVELNGVAFAEGDFSVGIDAVQRRSGRAGNREDDEMEKALQVMEESLQMMREAITLSSSYILTNGRELWFQVHGRLKRAGERNKLIREYVRGMESDAPKPGVLCTKGFLMEPGGANTRIISVGSCVECMVVLKDGERVACGCRNGEIVIVNVCQSDVEMRWRAHKRKATAIDVGKDGTRIVSGSGDGPAKVWDVESGECVATFDGHSDFLTRVATTQDGKRVVSGYLNGEVQVWDIDSGQGVGPSIKPDSMELLTVFKDGEHVVMGGWNVELEIWNMSTNEKVGASFDGHTWRVGCAAMTDDESRLVSGSWNGTIRTWDVEGRKQIGDSFKGHESRVTCVAMSEDGRRVVSGSRDKTIRVWDVESGEQVCDPLIGHTDEVTGVSFMEEKDTIVSCSEDGTVRVWDLNKEKVQAAVEKHNDRVSCVSFTPCGKFVVSGSWDGTLRVWNAMLGETVGEPMFDEESISYELSRFAITPDGRFVVSASYDRMVRVWDLQTRALVRIFEGHTGFVECVVVTPGGDRAVTGSHDRSVRVWDLKSMDGSHFLLEGHSAAAKKLFVTDDGKRIVSVDDEKNIFVWDIETQLVIKRVREDDAETLSRRQVLALAGEGTVHDEAGLSIALWGKEIVHGEGSEARVLSTLESPIMDWDISPDKRTICLGLNDGHVGFLKFGL